MRGRLIFAILATVAGLSAVDVFLARTETREVGRAARRDFEAGSRLLAQGRAAEAIGPLQKAHVQDRNDRVFTLELAEALMQAGRAEQAGVLLRSELERTPNDGRANLLEARLLALKGEYGDARPYYHRAIYGNWAEQPGRQRMAARLELAGLLVSHGSSEELLAELLPLEWEAGGDLKLRKRLASLYLAAKSPARAGNAYRALVRDDPQDSDNHKGLGQAELASGNYRTAQSEFQKAGAKDEEALARELAELDPTGRNLSTAAKLERSIAILKRAGEAAGRCSPELGKQAEELLAKRIRGGATNELAEERLELAERLWQAKQEKCGATALKDEQILGMLLAKRPGQH